MFASYDSADSATSAGRDAELDALFASHKSSTGPWKVTVLDEHNVTTAFPTKRAMKQFALEAVRAGNPVIVAGPVYHSGRDVFTDEASLSEALRSRDE